MECDKTHFYEIYGSTRTIYETTPQRNGFCVSYTDLIVENQFLRNAANGFNDRAEKAINDIYLERPCSICSNNDGGWNSQCASCDSDSNAYRPDFKWRGEKEDTHDFDRTAKKARRAD